MIRRLRVHQRGCRVACTTDGCGETFTVTLGWPAVRLFRQPVGPPVIVRIESYCAHSHPYDRGDLWHRALAGYWYLSEVPADVL